MHSVTVINHVHVGSDVLLSAALNSHILAECFPVKLQFDNIETLQKGCSYPVKASLAGKSIDMIVRLVHADEHLFHLQAEGPICFTMSSTVESLSDSCLMTTTISVQAGAGLAGKIIYGPAKKILDLTAVSCMDKFVCAAMLHSI